MCIQCVQNAIAELFENGNKAGTPFDQAKPDNVVVFVVEDGKPPRNVKSSKTTSEFDFEKAIHSTCMEVFEAISAVPKEMTGDEELDHIGTLILQRVIRKQSEATAAPSIRVEDIEGFMGWSASGRPIFAPENGTDHRGIR